MRAPALWLIAAGHGSALLVVSAVMVHFVTDVTERLGFSLRQAAGIVALMTVVQIAGQLGGGFAGDRFSKRAIVVGCMVAHAVALFVLASATTVWMIVVFAVLHGLAWGVRGPLMAALRADYFGSASFGMITGISSMVVMIGMMAGPLVAGILADRTGSYQTGFRVLAACAALGSIFFLLARRPEPPHRAPAGVPHPPYRPSRWGDSSPDASRRSRRASRCAGTAARICESPPAAHRDHHHRARPVRHETPGSPRPAWLHGARTPRRASSSAKAVRARGDAPDLPEKVSDSEALPVRPASLSFR